MRWIVTANTNCCRIYEHSYRKLKPVKEIYHPENKLKNKDLVTDRPGHYKSNSVNRGVYVPHTEPIEAAVDNFAKEMATELNEARNHNNYNNLVFIMPAQIEGLVTKNLNKNVRKMVKVTVHKNIMHMSEKELLEIVNENRIPMNAKH